MQDQFACTQQQAGAGARTTFTVTCNHVVKTALGPAPALVQVQTVQTRASLRVSAFLVSFTSLSSKPPAAQDRPTANCTYNRRAVGMCSMLPNNLNQKIPERHLKRER
jgi:hypothetical protein